MRAGGSNLGGMSRRNRANLGKESGDGPSTAARITLLSAIIAALIGGTATVLAALISNGSSGTPFTLPPATAPTQPEAPGEMPLPTCPTCIAGGKIFTQQASGTSPKPTFRDPRAFKGQGPAVQPGQQVEVVCRFHDPNAPSSVQPGWWYLIASPPWNRQYYTVANSYRNGDPPEGPFLTSVDNSVPVC
jgi:hypothetical protein